jgi:hypothetical protein
MKSGKFKILPPPAFLLSLEVIEIPKQELNVRYLEIGSWELVIGYSEGAHCGRGFQPRYGQYLVIGVKNPSHRVATVINSRD